MSLKLLQAAEGSLPLWADGPLALGRQWVLPHLCAGHPCRVLRGTARDGAAASVMADGNGAATSANEISAGQREHRRIPAGCYTRPDSR